MLISLLLFHIRTKFACNFQYGSWKKYIWNWLQLFYFAIASSLGSKTRTQLYVYTICCCNTQNEGCRMVSRSQRTTFLGRKWNGFSYKRWRFCFSRTSHSMGRACDGPQSPTWDFSSIWHWTECTDRGGRACWLQLKTGNRKWAIKMSFTSIGMTWQKELPL